MKRAFIAAALIALSFAVSAFAADSGGMPAEPVQTFEQKQANILKMMDDRIAGLQDGKTCVQAATSNADLKACRKKHMSEMWEKRGDMKHQRGMMGCPQSGMSGSSGQ